MQEKILVTPRSVTKNGHPSLKKLSDAGYSVVFPRPGVQPDEAELAALLPDCVGYLAGVEPVTRRVLSAAGKLKVISRNGTGVDAIDLDAAKEMSIAVLRAEGANARGVAELAVGLMFALARDIPASDNRLKRCEWERSKGFELYGKTLGLVGCGKIGRLVAQMALGIGMKVLAYDLYPDESFRPGAEFAWKPLAEVVRDAHILSLHCPPSGGRPLVDATFLRSCRKGVYIINTARGELLDENAVHAALESGVIAGLALDAFVKEPPGKNPLVEHPRTIATPHIGAFTDESVDRACECAVDSLLGYLKSH